MFRFLGRSFLLWLLILSLSLPSNLWAFGRFGIQDEAELGKEFQVLMQAKFPVIKDPIVVDYIQGLLDRVRQGMPPQPFALTLSVLLDPSINAFAAPAGYVFINTGLIQEMEDEGELAAVLAHELAHVAERHISQRIEQSQLVSIGTLVGVLAGALLGGGGSALGEALAVGSMATGQAASLKYSRDDEREADRMGLHFLTQAGYDPMAMKHSFEHIKENMRMSGTTTPPAYMLTHPGLNERIGSVQDVARHFPPKNPLAKKDNQTLERIKLLLQTKYTPTPGDCPLLSQATSDLTCLQVLGKAIVQARLNRMQEAEATFAQALDCRNRDALWLREAGWFAFEQGNYQRALNLLNQALREDAGDYLTRYYRARVLAETGATAQAVTDLRLVLQSVPEEEEVHRTLGRVVGRSGDHFHGYLHLAYASLYDHKPKETASYWKKAKELASGPGQKDALERFETQYEERQKIWAK